MKATLLAVSCLLTLPLMAQNIAPRSAAPRVVPPPGQQALAETTGLEQNITIRLQGTTTTGSDIDLSLTGVGPKFSADQVVNNDTVLSCEYLVSETETGYKVSYVVTARIKMATNVSATSTNFEYRDVSISGSAICTAGRPLVLLRNGAKPLQLTISKEPEQTAPDKARDSPKPE